MTETEKINLLVSCPNEGGLVLIRNGTPVYVDAVDTTGICFHRDKLFRCIQNTKDTPLKIVVYAKRGSTRLVFPEIRDVHDIMSYDGRLFLVSTGSNQIFEVSPNNYGVLQRHKLRGKGDAWHLNCLEVYQNRVIVSAFGKFRRHRGYKGKTQGAGIVFDLLTGKTLLKGLSQPHSPQVIDGRLFICNSEEKTVHCIDPDSGSKTVLEFENYTRGIACSDDHIYVGISSSRNIAQESKHSKIAVLSRNTLERIGEVRLECPEIYNISAIPGDTELSPENLCATNMSL